MTFTRRAFALGTAAIAGVAALPAFAQANLSADDRAVLARAQATLQNLASAQGSFVETSGAQRREGRFWLQRPGKMRFEYSNPAGLLVVSDGSNVKRFDPRLNVFRQVPLSQTPLSTFLARTVRLDQASASIASCACRTAAIPLPPWTPVARTTGLWSSCSAARPSGCWNGPSVMPKDHDPHPADRRHRRTEPGRQPVPAARPDPAPPP